MQLPRLVEVIREGAAVRDLAAGDQIERPQLVEQVEHARTAAGYGVDVGIKAAVPCHDVAVRRVFVLADEIPRAAHRLRRCQTIGSRLAFAVPAVEAACLDDGRIIPVAAVLVDHADAVNTVGLDHIRFAAVLPHAEVVARIATGVRPVREPHVIFFDDLLRDVVFYLLKARVEHGEIARLADTFEEYAAHAVNVLIIPAAVPLMVAVRILHVEGNGQCRAFTLQEPQNVLQLAFSARLGTGVGIEVRAPRHVCRLGFADIFLPEGVVLLGNILTEAAADHDEIITRRLDFPEIDLAVVGGNVHALFVFYVHGLSSPSL